MSIGIIGVHIMDLISFSQSSVLPSSRFRRRSISICIPAFTFWEHIPRVGLRDHTAILCLASRGSATPPCTAGVCTVNCEGYFEVQFSCHLLHEALCIMIGPLCPKAKTWLSYGVSHMYFPPAPPLPCFFRRSTLFLSHAVFVTGMCSVKVSVTGMNGGAAIARLVLDHQEMLMPH